jgi:hypothetical protein
MIERFIPRNGTTQCETHDEINLSAAVADQSLKIEGLAVG